MGKTVHCDKVADFSGMLPGHACLTRVYPRTTPGADPCSSRRLSLSHRFRLDFVRHGIAARTPPFPVPSLMFLTQPARAVIPGAYPAPHGACARRSHHTLPFPKPPLTTAQADVPLPHPLNRDLARFRPLIFTTPCVPPRSLRPPHCACRRVLPRLHGRGLARFLLLGLPRYPGTSCTSPTTRLLPTLFAPPPFERLASFFRYLLFLFQAGCSRVGGGSVAHWHFWFAPG